MIPVNRPLVSDSDIEAVAGAARESWISGEGPYVKCMEDTLAGIVGASHAVAVSSGTSACDLVSEALPIRRNDEVIAPALTIISTISGAVRRGAKLTLIDADRETWCMKADMTVDRLKSTTRLVSPVHIFGLPVDMDPIMTAARSLGVPVIEDAAEAIGLRYKGRMCGSLSDGAVFSFYANKTVTGGEGGAVVTNDTPLADRIRDLRNLCFRPEERFVHKELGFNARMSSLVAALVTSQLGRLDALIARKRQIGLLYQEGLAGHPWLQLPKPDVLYAENTYWVFGVVLTDDAPAESKELQGRLQLEGIETRRFFCPLNLQPVLLDMKAVTTEPMPEAERLWYRGLYVPSGIGTTDAEIQRTIDALWALAR